MKEFKYYKQLIGAIILAGIMIMMALRISDIASGLDAIFTAFVPLIVGACIAFVLDILVVRYERCYGLSVTLDGSIKYVAR